MYKDKEPNLYLHVYGKNLKNSVSEYVVFYIIWLFMY